VKFEEIDDLLFNYEVAVGIALDLEAKGEENVLLRAAFMTALAQTTNYTAIANYFGLHRSTVMRHCKNHRKNMYKSGYKRMYNIATHVTRSAVKGTADVCPMCHQLITD